MPVNFENIFHAASHVFDVHLIFLIFERCLARVKADDYRLRAFLYCSLDNFILYSKKYFG